jgi:hypothetical protein
MGFNSAFKGLNGFVILTLKLSLVHLIFVAVRFPEDSFS